MKITYISIFPEIFDSFLKTSLIKRGCEDELLAVSRINPRDFCFDKHRQVDDEIYGGGSGLLLKAEPVIQSIELAIKAGATDAFLVIFVSPSKKEFTQQVAENIKDAYEHIIFVCGRYEGIDYRVELWCEDTLGDKYMKLSLGKFITLGGEIPSMVMSEAIVRLIPEILHDAQSVVEESYSMDDGMSTLEYPQYTRPESVRGYEVPEILFSGHHKNIEERRKVNRQKIDD